MSISKIIQLKLVTHDRFRNVTAYGRLGRSYRMSMDMAEHAKPTVKPEVVLDRVMLHARYEDDPVALALLDLTEQLIEANTRGQAAADEQDKIIESMEQTMADYNERIASAVRSTARMVEQKQAYDEAIAESFLDAKQRRRLTALLSRKLRLLKERDQVAGIDEEPDELGEGIAVTFEVKTHPGWTSMIKDTMGRSQPYGQQIRGKGTKRP